MSDFIHFEDRASEHPLIERVWRCHSERADRFLSVAENTFEIVVTHVGRQKFLTLRGPETLAAPIDCPSDGQWIAIRFKPGTFMPYARAGILERDPVVIDTLKRLPHELSLRSVQRHFEYPTGISYATFRQIERARSAVQRLRDGAPILDVVAVQFTTQLLGYPDSAVVGIGATPFSVHRTLRHSAHVATWCRAPHRLSRWSCCKQDSHRRTDFRCDVPDRFRGIRLGRTLAARYPSPSVISLATMNAVYATRAYVRQDFAPGCYRATASFSLMLNP